MSGEPEDTPQADESNSGAENTTPAEEGAAEEVAEKASEPSTEKSAEEEPKAPQKPADTADHNAVGIGVVGEPIEEEHHE